MKHFLVFLLLTLIALPALAQRRPNPRRPIPRYPAPTNRPCQVVAVDRYHRVMARFQAWTDYRGMCREGLRQCNYEIRRRGWWDARCLQTRY